MELQKRRFEVVSLAEVAPLLGIGREPAQGARREKILSISYHENLAITRSLLFSAAGFQVSSALNLAKAVELCKAESFHLIVIGHSLPASEKEELLKRIRKFCATPVLALYYRGEGRLQGADYALDSTEGPAALLETVERIIRGEQP